MKFLYLVLMIILLIGSCKKNKSTNISQNQIEFEKVDTNSLATKLELAYKNGLGDDIEFLNLFPDDFTLFNELYGFDDILGEGKKLYDFYEEHIEFICNSKKIPVYTKLNKFIRISVNGKWEADAVGLLQDCTRQLIINNPETSIEIINLLNESDANSVWYFIFDGPHPSNHRPSFDSLYQVINLIDPDQATSMQKEYQKLLQEEELN